jgi:hypothetical protein
MKTLREELTRVALLNVEETGINPSEDLESLLAGETAESLLARCLDGADEDRVQGWREYVETLESEASRQMVDEND